MTLKNVTDAGTTLTRASMPGIFLFGVCISAFATFVTWD